MFYELLIVSFKISIENLKNILIYISTTSWKILLITSFINRNYIYALYNKVHISLYKLMYYTRIYKFWRKFNLKPHSYYYYREFFNKKFSHKDTLNILFKSIVYKNELPHNEIKLSSYFISFFNNTKYILIPSVLSLFFYSFLQNFYSINLSRQLALWFIIGMLFFWLFSGFNFFIKRYRYAKFTSVILRFWKRTNTYFWIAEGFLFALFAYYYLNSSQEPCYSYDYISLNYSFLPNLFIIYFNNWILIFCIIFLFFWVLNLNSLNFVQNTFFALIVILLVVYLYLIESYQFYYILTYLFESLWSYSYEENLWTLETESPRTRAKQQYLIAVLIAKYWHFIFIFLSILFWSLKSFEEKKTHYTLSGYNVQNLIILFWLNILIIAQWFKWAYRRFFDNIYFWFFTDTNNNYIQYFFYELIGEVRHHKY